MVGVVHDGDRLHDSARGSLASPSSRVPIRPADGLGDRAGAVQTAEDELLGPERVSFTESAHPFEHRRSHRSRSELVDLVDQLAVPDSGRSDSRDTLRESDGLGDELLQRQPARARRSEP